jgi:UMF1 family MFS transporter
VNFLVYFSKWLVLDGGIPDILYNSVFVVVAIALLFTAPALAAHTDQCGGRKKFLNISTVGIIASYLTAALTAIYGAPVIFSFIAFLLGQFFYQMSFVFLDPILNDLADEKHRSRASGIAQACSNVGMIFGIAISLPLIAHGRLASLIPACILFALLALPTMILYKEKPTPAPAPTRICFGFDWRKFWKFIMTSAAAPILIAFFFYTNALNTITNNYSIYAGSVLNMPDDMTSIILGMVFVAGAVGSLLAGWAGDRFGTRRCLIAILWIWLCLIPAMAFVNNQAAFFGMAAILGLSIGAGWAVSRAYISTSLESENVGYGFSFYVLFEKFSSMVGPLVWGGILSIGFGYRAAMLSMALFIIAGIYTLTRKKI